MNSSLLSSNITEQQREIDNILQNINLSPSDSVLHKISIISFTFALLGSISNFMSVIVLSRLSSNLSTFIYLTGLSLSDMITCLSIMMTHFIDFLSQVCRNATFMKVALRIQIIFGALATGSRVLSLWISTAVTLDRWILICYPTYSRTFCKLNRAKILRQLLFTIAVIYSIPLTFEYEVFPLPIIIAESYAENDSLSNLHEHTSENNFYMFKRYSKLAQLRSYRWSYMFFNIIFVYTLPTLIIIIFNLQLIRTLHRVKSRTKRLKAENSSNSIKYHKKRIGSHQTKYSVTLIVIIMVLTLLLCRSPTSVLWILWSFDLTIKTFFDSSSSLFVRRFHATANLIAIINAATNFLPFCVFGQLFRSECLHIYCCQKPLLNEQTKYYIQEENNHENKHRQRANTPSPQVTHVQNSYLKKAVSFYSDTTSSPNASSYNHQNIIGQHSQFSDRKSFKETVDL